MHVFPFPESLVCVFMVSSGVRQGSVLSPLLFAVYVDDIGKLHNSRVGKFVVLYADDLLLLAPSDHSTARITQGV